ncbi:MAG: DUF4147 domain-containing protein [Planctomycetota bacterium]|nr:DUF4147 domain-containing protein [Planctomycetota bacterium]MDA1214524.1 DUF4147 domain-containing protein [Planctomycetota bacterium]
MTLFPASPDKLTADALSIWQSGVAAVDSSRLVADAVRVSGNQLSLAGEILELRRVSRLIVVGTGKAGAGMARGFEQALRTTDFYSKITGWMNVPGDCVSTLEKIHLHAARPAGLNEPTQEGVEGAEHILELVAQAQPEDVVVVLLSGGGSALLPSPKEGMTLADKQVVTRLLMQRGATIHELNTVRKHLSRIKGGGLARACRAGLMICLVISDVCGDPLEIIASGPTVSDTSTPQQAWDILTKFVPNRDELPVNVCNVFDRELKGLANASADHTSDVTCRVRNIILGNNSTALQAAERHAVSLGYRVVNLGSDHQGIAREVGGELADLCRNYRQQREPGGPPLCLLSGGEPVVNLIPTTRARKGGRNQELALSALDRLWTDGCEGIVLLSGGTDGEDGPTDAAGAYVDQSVWLTAHQQNLHPHDYLEFNDAYHFFQETGGLIITGPTHTNVMDVRVCLVG